MEGTYPLPELDRFMLRLSLGYPDPASEVSILLDDPGRRVLPTLEAVVTREEILAARRAAASVYARPELTRTIVEIADGSRRDSRLRYGVSPRGSLHLLDAMRALAFLRGRDYVSETDLLELAGPVLAHRVRPAGRDHAAEDVVAELAATAVGRLREADGV